MVTRLLGRVTIYRLVVAYLSTLLGISCILAAANVLPFSPEDILYTAGVLSVACFAWNWIFARMVGAPRNLESPFISSIILALIIGPITIGASLPELVGIAALAMGSKYIIAPGKRHIFNPAAFAVVISGIFFNLGASWWVGSPFLFPLVLLGGWLVVLRLRRLEMVGAFLLTYLGGFILLAVSQGVSFNFATQLAGMLLIGTPILFLATVMLTEPLTEPPTARLQLVYAVVIALAILLLQNYVPQFGASFEFALILGNVFSYVVRQGARYQLKLKEKRELAPGIYEFTFTPSSPIPYRAGQYLEWTLPHHKPDFRGVRRYFTIASSPAEPDISLAVKVPERASSYKQALLALNPGDELSASHLAGDFVLPDDAKQRVVFIAGGIGITPFVSMLRYCLDTKRKQPITLIYAAQSPKEFVYEELIAEAKKTLGLELIEVAAEAPAAWGGHRGFVTAELIKEVVEKPQEPLYYVSGPDSMVQAMAKELRKLGVSRRNIKRDYFPGY